MLREPRIKFCGVTHPADVEACIGAGAWAIGAVMTPHGPRALGADDARAVMREVPQGTERVGVFVQPSADAVARAVDACRLTRIQVHGVDDPRPLAAAAGVPVTLAVPLRDEGAGSSPPPTETAHGGRCMGTTVGWRVAGGAWGGCRLASG